MLGSPTHHPGEETTAEARVPDRDGEVVRDDRDEIP
jgi:hypothetical protein